MNSPFDQKLARIFADVTDNGSSDADPEIMAMHVSKLCRFVTLIGGREVPEIAAELDRYGELLPYYSMLEALRVTLRRLLPDGSHSEPSILGPLASTRKENITGSLSSLTVNYSVTQPPSNDTAAIPLLFQHGYAIIKEQIAPRPINVTLLLDFAVKRGRELGLDVRDEDGDGPTFDEDRNLLRFFHNVSDDEDETSSAKPAAPAPANTATDDMDTQTMAPAQPPAKDGDDDNVPF